jgi:hypothetical protein
VHDEMKKEKRKIQPKSCLIFFCMFDCETTDAICTGDKAFATQPCLTAPRR